VSTSGLRNIELDVVSYVFGVAEYEFRREKVLRRLVEIDVSPFFIIYGYVHLLSIPGTKQNTLA
jgi:hypothetical protein